MERHTENPQACQSLESRSVMTVQDMPGGVTAEVEPWKLTMSSLTAAQVNCLFFGELVASNMV